jgi:hypothetical protein
LIAPFVHATSELPERTSSIATTDLVDWLAERVVMPEHLSNRGVPWMYLRVCPCAGQDSNLRPAA